MGFNLEWKNYYLGYIFNWIDEMKLIKKINFSFIYLIFSI